jgi:uncharacterized membrane protein (DUF106 family)
MAFDIAVLISTFSILAIALVISFINTGVNRALISKLVGWKEYRAMQKEISEYRSATMKAARASDRKEMEKLKKKESQINAMNMKMMKPQYAQLGISVIYIAIWYLFLIPTYGTSTVAFIPGIGTIAGATAGAIGVTVWYFICSLFFSIVAQRVLGVLPIE